MRWMIRAILALALLWGGYWVIGSRAMDRAAQRFFDRAAERGLVAEQGGIEVAGFPSRFDLTVTDPKLVDPARGIGWSAPFVQILTLSYTPWHLIAALPNDQTLDLPDQSLKVQSSYLQGSVVVTPGTALTLDRLAAEARDLRVTSTLGWVLGAADVQLHTRQNPATVNAHDIDIAARDVIPDPALMALAGADADLPDKIAQMRLTATAALTAPVDRYARETRPQITALAIREASVTWGDVVLFAKGDLVTDRQGRAEGKLELRLENWRTLVPVAIAMGVIPPDTAPTVEQVMTVFAKGGDTLTVPVTFKDGRTSLGPIPLGPAPRIAQRQ